MAERDTATSAGVPGGAPTASSLEKVLEGDAQEVSGTPPIPARAGNAGIPEAAGKPHPTGQA